MRRRISASSEPPPKLSPAEDAGLFHALAAKIECMGDNPYKAPSEAQAIKLLEGSRISDGNLRSRAKTFLAFFVFACIGMALIAGSIVLWLSLRPG